MVCRWVQTVDERGRRRLMATWERAEEPAVARPRTAAA